MDLLTTFVTIFVSIAILLVLVNYFLRYQFENRYLDANSEYLISSPLVQFAAMMTFCYWMTQLMEEVRIVNDLFEDKKAVFILFLLCASIGSVVVTVTVAMSVFHVFRRNGNADLLKRLSYIGTGLIVLTSLLGIVAFSEITAMIIAFVLLVALVGWFEYMYCLSVDQFFMNGKAMSYQERILAMLERNAKTTSATTAPTVEKPKKFCPNCGERIDADSKVCPICREETNF
ncbi:MAG: hypothetical protein IJV05_04070 [Muribaculaceae bacterium]|nr:hypothetical protein [Muribaculaceae bacterium]